MNFVAPKKKQKKNQKLMEFSAALNCIQLDGLIRWLLAVRRESGCGSCMIKLFYTFCQ